MPYGKQAQVDFGSYNMHTSDGRHKKINFFAMVLSRSRMKYIWFVDKPFTAWSVCQAHENAFHFFDGIAEVIVYDQDRTLIVDENLGDVILTATFKQYTRSRSFDLHFCRKSDPESKGKVENVIQFVKKNFLFNRSYSDLETLNTQALACRFADRRPIIKDISFEVNKGEVIAIMGENGCGKSTLVQILQKNYKPENGNIIVNNNASLQDISTTDWRKTVGVVPQNIHIFNGTVLDNIAFDDVQNKTQDVALFLQQYGFAAFIDSLPQSIMTLVGEEGINLSGGQKQMIALARALYHKPQLLIMDEATAAMDRQSEQFVLQLLQHLKNKMGIIFITDRLHILKSFCDRIYIMEKGSIINHGDHSYLLQSKNLYVIIGMIWFLKKSQT